MTTIKEFLIEKGQPAALTDASQLAVVAVTVGAYSTEERSRIIEVVAEAAPKHSPEFEGLTDQTDIAITHFEKYAEDTQLEDFLKLIGVSNQQEDQGGDQKLPPGGGGNNEVVVADKTKSESEAFALPSDVSPEKYAELLTGSAKKVEELWQTSAKSYINRVVVTHAPVTAMYERTYVPVTLLSKVEADKANLVQTKENLEAYDAALKAVKEQSQVKPNGTAKYGPYRGFEVFIPEGKEGLTDLFKKESMFALLYNKLSLVIAASKDHPVSAEVIRLDIQTETNGEGETTTGKIKPVIRYTGIAEALEDPKKVLVMDTPVEGQVTKKSIGLELAYKVKKGKKTNGDDKIQTVRLRGRYEEYPVFQRADPKHVSKFGPISSKTGPQALTADSLEEIQKRHAIISAGIADSRFDTSFLNAELIQQRTDLAKQFGDIAQGATSNVTAGDEF